MTERLPHHRDAVADSYGPKLEQLAARRRARAYRGRRAVSALAKAILLASFVLGCERPPLAPRVDTLVVHDTVPLLRVDTLLVPRVDTVVSVQHDTSFVPRTDTLLVPSPAVHDTTWLYTQTNPTNPFAGGDPISGLLVLQVWSSYYLVFWHGHFMGVLMQGGYGASEYWNAYGRPLDGSIVMPLYCTKPTWREAAGCLEPLVLTLEPSAARLVRRPR